MPITATYLITQSRTLSSEGVLISNGRREVSVPNQGLTCTSLTHLGADHAACCNARNINPLASVEGHVPDLQLQYLPKRGERTLMGHLRNLVGMAHLSTAGARGDWFGRKSPVA